MVWAISTTAQGSIPQPILVRLQSSQDLISLRGRDLRMDGHAASGRKNPSSDWRIRLASQGSQPHWIIEPKEMGSPRRLKGSELRITGREISVQGRRAPDDLFLVPLEESRFDVLASLDLESYLEGVVASEMPARWPLEALKAQAIAARTYVLKSRQDRQGQTFHVESSVWDQVYDYEKIHGLPASLRHRIAEAVRQTAGQVLVDNAGELIRAHYHADCGGRTEPAHHVWPGARSAGAARDSFCPRSPMAKWSARFSRAAIELRLRAWLPRGGRVENLEVQDHTASGRVAFLRIQVGGASAPVILSGADFRKTIGLERIRSTFFEVVQDGDEYVIRGRGHGHGVGLCQWGAHQLAVTGATASRILKHYYPQARVVNAVTGVRTLTGSR